MFRIASSCRGRQYTFRVGVQFVCIEVFGSDCIPIFRSQEVRRLISPSHERTEEKIDLIVVSLFHLANSCPLENVCAGVCLRKNVQPASPYLLHPATSFSFFINASVASKGSMSASR